MPTLFGIKLEVIQAVLIGASIRPTFRLLYGLFAACGHGLDGQKLFRSKRQSSVEFLVDDDNKMSPKSASFADVLALIVITLFVY
jgi:hypothetical protein